MISSELSKEEKKLLFFIKHFSYIFMGIGIALYVFYFTFIMENIQEKESRQVQQNYTIEKENEIKKDAQNLAKYMGTIKNKNEGIPHIDDFVIKDNEDFFVQNGQKVIRGSKFLRKNPSLITKFLNSNRQGGFYSYEHKKLYLVPLKNSNWIAGAEYDTKKLHHEILSRQSKLKKVKEIYQKNIRNFSIIFGLILLVASLLISSKIKSIFLSYKKHLHNIQEKEKENLKHSERLYKGFYEENNVVIFIVDLEDANILDANKSACEFYGYTKEQMLKLKSFDLNTAPKSDIFKAIKQIKSMEKNHFEFTHKLANGELKHVMVTTSITVFKGKEALYAVIHDITKEYEQKEKKQILENVFKHAEVGLVLLNRRGIVINVNKKALKMFEKEEHELINIHYSKLPFAQVRKKYVNLFEEMVAKKISNFHFRTIMLTKDGKKFDALTNAACILGSDQEVVGILGTFVDITEMRQKDRALIQQSKMALMGEMIGNIAHQWRQPLNALGLTIQNIKVAYDNDILTKEHLYKSVYKSKKLTQQMSNTIDDFRNFFKPIDSKESFKLKNSIASCLELTEESLKNHNIEVILQIDENTEIYAIKSQFLQVILNLISNAKDALLINKVKNAKIVFSESADKNYINLHVRDNAGGIDKEIFENIFEPYFSTKKEKNGTGLGLYMSKMIIEQHANGILEAKNVENGAEFTIKVKRKDD